MQGQAKQVADVLGINRAAWELRNMARALSIFQILNTHTENERLRCAKWALTHWHAYCAECDRRRSRRA